MTADTHRCIAGPACRNAERIDGKRHGTLTIDADTLCDACNRHIADCTRQLVSDYQMLADSLGERATITGEFVTSTPTPAIPINAAAEALMSEILEIADRAASVVAAALDLRDINGEPTQPNGRQTPPRYIVKDDAEAERMQAPVGPLAARHGTIALAAHTKVRPTNQQTLNAAVKLVEPNLDKLIAAPADPHIVWALPRRCDRHTGLIGSAEAWLSIAPPSERELARDELTNALRGAAACDHCNGWDSNTKGQARSMVEYTGLDIAQQIRNIHHQARAHLGHTRLRNKFSTPCPAVNAQGIYCGAITVGHDDGSDWVNCTTCGVQWLEDEWDFLSTLIKDWEIEVLRWLLAEAQWRLDTLQRGADAIRDDPRLDSPGSGRFVLEGIDIVLAAGDGHKRPEERATTPDRKKGGKRK